MKTPSLLHRLAPAVCGLILFAQAQPDARAEEDFIGDVHDHLKFQAFDGNFTAQISGLLDMEGYYFHQPAPALIETNHDFLFNPRLTLYLDAQAGTMFYFFMQARVDRGYDPADANMRIRLDEYALRFTPWSDGRLNVQFGKFATVIGQWTRRHDSWENPFITAPLPYENLTSMWDSAAVDSAATLLSWYDSAKNLRLPVVWGADYATGAAVSGRVGKFDYAAEVKNSAPSARVEYWDTGETGFDHPTFSGRIGWRPDQAWNFGVSASTGAYLSPDATSTLLAGRSFGAYRQILVAQDASFAWHHFQVWAEVFENRFEIPGVGNADALAYYLEAKYKFTPEFFAALRWNQELYSDFPDGLGESVPWSYNSWRIDAAVAYRFTPYTQLKLQYSFLRQDHADTQNQNIFALQMTVRF